MVGGERKKVRGRGRGGRGMTIWGAKELKESHGSSRDLIDHLSIQFNGYRADWFYRIIILCMRNNLKC